MLDDVRKILNQLGLEDTGRYENHFYIINVEDSNEYAKLYTILDKYAQNTEYPAFEGKSKDTVSKVTNYFEIGADKEVYTLFLMADFDKDEYKLKIGLQEK